MFSHIVLYHISTIPHVGPAWTCRFLKMKKNQHNYSTVYNATVFLKKNETKHLKIPKFSQSFEFFPAIFQKRHYQGLIFLFLCFCDPTWGSWGKKGTLTSWPAASAPPHHQLPTVKSANMNQWRVKHKSPTNSVYHCKFIPLLWIIFSIWGDSFIWFIRFTLKMIHVCRFDGTGHWLDMNQTFVD